MNTVLKLHLIKGDLTAIEKGIAKYLLDTKDDIGIMKVADVADKCYTSTASINRFCKKIGYDGYKGFKVDWIRNNTIINQRKYKEAEKGTELLSVKEIVFNELLIAIDDAKLLIDNEMIEKAADLIIGANKLCFYGIGDSGMVADDAKKKFEKLSKYAKSYLIWDDQIVSASLLNEDDVVVAISHSGETEQVISSVVIAKEHGAKIISITKDNYNKLSQLADINISVGGEERLIERGGTVSRIVMLTVIDILWIECLKRNENEYMKRMKYLAQTIRKHKK